MKSAAVRVAVLFALLAATPAFSKTYNIAEILPNGAVTGSIVTDGTIGTLGASNILDWNLNLNFFDVSHPDGQLTGPLSGNNATLGLTSSDLTADAFGLYFNFDRTHSDALSFISAPGDGTSNAFRLINQSSAQDPVNKTFMGMSYINNNIGLLDSGPVHPVGNLQFAIDPTPFDDNIVTPLPAALPLFAGGLGVIGLLARRRKQRAAT